MKTGRSAILISVLFILMLPLAAMSAKQPDYASEKPFHLSFVLDEANSKVLTLAFDESGGTLKGYDTIYADVNLNGDLTDDKPIKGNPDQVGTERIACPFPPIVLKTPYNEKAKGVERPWEFNFQSFQSRSQPRFLGLVKGRVNQVLFLEAKMRLKDAAAEWEYFWPQAFSAGSLNGMSPFVFAGKPTLEVHAIRDTRNEGNTGIAVLLTTGPHKAQLTCKKDDLPPTAQVRVMDTEGNVVLSENVALDKLSFG